MYILQYTATTQNRVGDVDWCKYGGTVATIFFSVIFLGREVVGRLNVAPSLPVYLERAIP